MAFPASPGEVPPVGAATGPGDRFPRPKAIRGRRSYGVRAHLARPDADDLFHRRDPHLAVADLVGAGGGDDGAGHPVDLAVVDQDLDPHLGHEVDRVLRAPVDLGVAPLTAEALDLRDGHAGDAEAPESLLGFIQLERLDDGGDEFLPVLPILPSSPNE